MAKRKPRPDLEGFEEWLLDRGLVPGTVGVYTRDVATAQREGGLLARLRSDDLAPKTKRHILAAARHWAEYTSDDTLLKALKRLRLPPPRRKSAKVPLPRQSLFDLVDEINTADYLTEPMRGVLGVLATRGLRCGDVLRLHRDELARAKESGTLAYEAKGRRRIEYRVLKTWRKPLFLLADQPGRWEQVDQLVAPGAAPAGRRAAAARAVERTLVRVGIRAGVHGLYPHRLRRTYAVEYLKALEGDPEALMKLTQHMGWASMATAMEYVDHARGAELDGAAERIFDRERS
jgi:site-specific recombinase XerC